MTVSTSWATSLGQSWTTSSGILDTRKLILETGQEFNQPRRIPAERDSGCTTWTLRTRTGCAHPRNRPNSTLKSWQTTVSLSENKQSEGHKKISPMPAEIHRGDVFLSSQIWLLDSILSEGDKRCFSLPLSSDLLIVRFWRPRSNHPANFDWAVRPAVRSLSVVVSFQRWWQSLVSTLLLPSHSVSA